MSRPFTKFEAALIGELANIASLLVDRLHAPRDPEEYPNLSSVSIREVVEATVRIAVARKRLTHLRRLRRPGRRDPLKLNADELARLHLEDIDLDAPFNCDDVLL